MSLDAAEQLLLMDATCTRVLIALHARFSRDRFCTVRVPRAFIAVWSGVPDIRTVRVLNKSEYAQSLVDPKRTLFDTDIEH